MKFKIPKPSTKAVNITLIIFFSILSIAFTFFILNNQEKKQVKPVVVEKPKIIKPLKLDVNKDLKAFNLNVTDDNLFEQKNIDSLFENIFRMKFNSIIIDVKNIDEKNELIINNAYSNSVKVLLKININQIKANLKNQDFSNYLKKIANDSKIYAIILDDYALKDTKSTSDAVISISKEIKKYQPKMLVSLSVNDVWANKSVNPLGSETNAETQDLINNFSDTKEMSNNEWIDFIVLKNFNAISSPSKPFGAVSNWWNGVLTTSNKPLLTILASSNISTTTNGWGGSDEIVRQYATIKKLNMNSGIALNSYKDVLLNQNNWTDLLLKYFNGEYADDQLFKELTITSPKKPSFSTTDASVIFSGQFDGTQAVTINNNPVKPTKNGEFYEIVPIDVGTNIITLTHKGKSVQYKITRSVKIIKSVNPSGTTKIDGESELSLSAVAYKGSIVKATLNKKTITLNEVKSGDDFDPNSSYATFRGVYLTPPKTTKEVSLGSVSVTGKYKSFSETFKGGTIIVNSKADEIVIPTPLPPTPSNPTTSTTSTTSSTTSTTSNPPVLPGDYKQIEVKVDYAKAYDVPVKKYNFQTKFNIPKGTTDYIKSESGDWYILNTGRAVLKSDVNVYTSALRPANLMSSVSSSNSQNTTTLKLKNNYKAMFDITCDSLDYSTVGDSTFTVKNFNSNTITVTFFYTTYVPNLPTDFVSNSNLFSAAKWEKGSDFYKLVLTLKKSGRYFGAYAYYSADGELTLNFNSITQLNGLKVFIDPGHGGSDPGATSEGVFEKDVTFGISTKLKAILESKGVSVGITSEAQRDASSSAKGTLANRVSFARSFNANMFLSIHCNALATTTPNWSTISGTETYYDSPFSQPLAKSINDNIANSLGSINRGDKQTSYLVLTYKAFPSVLVETEFLTNPTKRALLNSDDGQRNFAQAIANGIEKYVNG